MMDDSSAASPATVRPALSEEAASIAEMVYLCGPNLLSQAFGPGYEETLSCLTVLAEAPMTMFSYQFAHVASAGDDARSLAGLLIGLTQEDYAQSEQRLAMLTRRHKGFWKWLRLIPLAVELSRCAVPLAPGSYYISALSVREPWRQRGIGRQLLEFSQDLARERSCQRIVLDVEIGNASAQRLYERMGYSVTNECQPGRLMRRRGILGLRRMERNV